VANLGRGANNIPLFTVDSRPGRRHILGMRKSPKSCGGRNLEQVATASKSFDDVFAALRAILERSAGKLVVSEDSPTCYCLEGGLHPQHKTPMQIAWVKVGKNYVGFHHMGVYARPDLLKDVSQKLRARMQGKSCFNFASVDEPLFGELEELTVRAFEAFRRLPYPR
jgi:hypothetical protein